MPRNNRHRKKLRFFCDDSCFHAFWGQNGHRPAKTDRFFCDDNAGTGTSSMLKHDSPRASNVGAQHITYQHIMPSPLLPKPEGRRRNKLIIKRLSSTKNRAQKKAAPESDAAYEDKIRYYFISRTLDSTYVPPVPLAPQTPVSDSIVVLRLLV